MTLPPSGRARPLPPDQRRAALIAAALPLVARCGTKVTTRQIAEAAGVAEGTIFRVFDDKESLVKAAVAAALDPRPTIAELDRIDLALPLRRRLTTATGILRDRLVTVFNLLTAVGSRPPPADLAAHRAAARPAHDLMIAAVGRILEPDAEQFRLPVVEVARLLWTVTLSSSHPMLAHDDPFTPERIVAVLLDGVRHRPGEPC